jgi:hypothetical protein
MASKCLRGWWRAALVAALVSFVGVVHAEDVVRLHVQPIVYEKDDLTVQIRLVKNDDNRFMKVVATSAGYYGSSEMQLDGQQTSPLKVVKFRSLPAGWYEIVGSVYDGSYKMRGSARVTVLVFAR